MSCVAVSRRLLMLSSACLMVPSRPVHAASAVSSADAFVDSIGICVHLDSEPYRSRFDDVYRAVASLGVRHLRDELRPDNDLARWRRLYDGLSVRSHLLVSPATNTVPDMLDYLRRVGVETVSAIEGQNEGDSPWFMAQAVAQPDWAASVNAYQRSVYEAVRRHYPRAVLPVLSPSLLDYKPEDVPRIAASAAFSDAVSIHAYVQGGQEPETGDDYASLAWYLSHFRDVLKPAAPVMATEIGYHTGVGGVSALAAAKYLPRLLLHAFGAGVARTFLYELMDEGADPADSEQCYGLISATGMPKESFQTLCMLIAALADPGASVAAGPAPVTVLDAPDDHRLMAFSKSNGDIIVALWRAGSSWDPVTQSDRSVLPFAMKLQLLHTESRAATLRLEAGHDWTDCSIVAGLVSIDIDDTVCMLRLRR